MRTILWQESLKIEQILKIHGKNTQLDCSAESAMHSSAGLSQSFGLKVIKQY